MSPSSTATPDQAGVPGVMLPLPFSTADLSPQPSKEIVVDWQLPADGERRN